MYYEVFISDNNNKKKEKNKFPFIFSSLLFMYIKYIINILYVCMSIDTIFKKNRLTIKRKIIMHYYLTKKKKGNSFLLYQYAI